MDNAQQGTRAVVAGGGGGGGVGAWLRRTAGFLSAVSAEMKKKVDDARADIIAGKIKVADYMADNACKF
jgi:basic membrane protein A